jgi:2-C-methyl-D-erythritol 4-phosphate cytidylyltransferase
MGEQTTPKQLILLNQRPVLAHVIDAFRCVTRFAEIVVALPADRVEEWQQLAEKHRVPGHKTCVGGATRFLSIKAALAELSTDCEYIMVHDAARPLVSGELILRTLDVARKHGSAIPVVPLVDSVRRVANDESSENTGGTRGTEGAGGDSTGLLSGSWPVSRDELRAVQTPQVFRADILRTAVSHASGDDFSDDATLVESVGYTVMLCDGERRNIKITTREDIVIAEAMLIA